MILALLACAPPDWSRAEALRPALARVDRDGDGTLSRAEYERVAFNAPAFAAADPDGSGGVDLDELEALLQTQNPAVFHATARVPLPNFGAPPGSPTVKASEPGFTWLVLRLLREEVLARDPGAEVPTVEEIVAADAAGGLDSPAARALLVRLEVASARVGLGFPPSLAVGAGP